MTTPTDTSPQGVIRPTAGWVFARAERVLAFGFGSGLLRPAPGTWGTLLGWLLWAVLLRHITGVWMGVFLLAAFILGCWVTQRCGEDLGTPDHSGMNWDEMVAIWLVLWCLPEYFWTQLAGVVLFRFFDIIKPPPIGYLDACFKNGFGVMLDDLLAAVYALIGAGILIGLGVLA